MSHFCKKKNRCGTSCDCPAPYLGIEQLADNISVLRFNIGGKRADYDFYNLIYQNQTDTSIRADMLKRALVYMAERHMDSISAQELGGLLHLADISDVDSTGAENGSMLVYHKDSNCGEGCVGTGDKWGIWNALDHQVTSASYIMVFDEEGQPKTLSQPSNPDRYYQLGWNSYNQLSYNEIPIIDYIPKDIDGKQIALYLDPDNGQIIGVRS